MLSTLSVIAPRGTTLLEPPAATDSLWPAQRIDILVSDHDFSEAEAEKWVESTSGTVQEITRWSRLHKLREVLKFTDRWVGYELGQWLGSGLSYEFAAAACDSGRRPTEATHYLETAKDFDLTETEATVCLRAGYDEQTIRQNAHKAEFMDGARAIVALLGGGPTGDSQT